MKQIFQKCPNCQGRGYVYQINPTQADSDTPSCILCFDCNGRGRVPTAFYVEDMPGVDTTVMGS